MNSFKSKMMEKINIYSDKSYLNGYIKNEYLLNDKDQLIIFSIQDFNDNYNFYYLFYENTKK